MLPLEHSAILVTCIKQKLVLKTYFWSFSEWPFYTGFTVFLMSRFCFCSLPLPHGAVGCFVVCGFILTIWGFFPVSLMLRHNVRHAQIQNVLSERA